MIYVTQLRPFWLPTSVTVRHISGQQKGRFHDQLNVETAFSYARKQFIELICKIYLTIREMQYIICIVRREALEKLENEVQTH